MTCCEPIDTPDSTTAALSTAVLESLPDALIVTTFTSEILYLNAAAKRLLGTSLNTARGRTLSDVAAFFDGLTHEPVHDPLTRFLARGAERRPGEFYLLRRRNGTEVPIQDSCTIFHGLHGEAAGLVVMLRDATPIRDLARAAAHDPLTRLVNRQEFEHRLARLLDTLIPGDAHALLYLDLDRFKAVNDTHGHAAGDSVLRQVAEIFRGAVRERDTLARLGGDEFAVILEHCTFEHAREQARALAHTLAEREFQWDGMRIRLGVSVGTVALNAANRDLAAVLAAADRACYDTKRRAATEKPDSSPPRRTPP